MDNNQKTPEEEKRKKMMRIGILMTVAFVIDIGEAIIVYNAGKSAEAKTLGEKYKWAFPGGKALAKTAAIVLVTSLLTSVVVNYTEKRILERL